MAANFKIRDAGGVLRTIKKITIRDAANVPRVLKFAKIRDAANVLRTVFNAITVSASSAFAVGSNGGMAATGTVDSNVITVTATNGTAPYTYSWTRYSGSALITASAPATAATYFTATVSDSNPLTGTWKCDITDSAGATAVVWVDVELTWYDYR